MTNPKNKRLPAFETAPHLADRTGTRDLDKTAKKNYFIMQLIMLKSLNL